MNFGAKNFVKIFFLKNFEVTFVSPGPDLALKHPGALRLEVLQGLRRNYFVFFLNLDKLTKSIKSYGPKKVFLNKMSIVGAFLAIKVPRGREPDSKNLVNGEVSGIGTYRFEFSTIKTSITAYKMAFLTIIRKSPQKGVFLALRVPRGREPEFCQGQQ